LYRTAKHATMNVPVVSPPQGQGALASRESGARAPTSLHRRLAPTGHAPWPRGGERQGGELDVTSSIHITRGLPRSCSLRQGHHPAGADLGFRPPGRPASLQGHDCSRLLVQLPKRDVLRRRLGHSPRLGLWPSERHDRGQEPASAIRASPGPIHWPSRRAARGGLAGAQAADLRGLHAIGATDDNKNRPSFHHVLFLLRSSYLANSGCPGNRKTRTGSFLAAFMWWPRCRHESRSSVSTLQPGQEGYAATRMGQRMLRCLLRCDSSPTMADRRFRLLATHKSTQFRSGERQSNRAIMSIEAWKAVLHATGFTPTEKLVLLALANHADPLGRQIRPGVPRLMVYTSLAERTVRRTISDLVVASILRPVGERSRYGFVEYEMDLGQLSDVASQDLQDMHLSKSNGVPVRPSRGAPESARGARESRSSIKEPSINHHQEPSYPSTPAEAYSARPDGKHQKAILRTAQLTFQECTKITEPSIGTDSERKAAGRRWWIPLRRICELAKWDGERVCWIITEAVKRLDGRVTIAAPGSILATCEGIIGESNRGTLPTGTMTKADRDAKMLSEQERFRRLKNGERK